MALLQLANYFPRYSLARFRESQWLSPLQLFIFCCIFILLMLINSQLKVVLDEVAAGQGEVNFRVTTYSPVYSEILGLMSKCDSNIVH